MGIIWIQKNKMEKIKIDYLLPHIMIDGEIVIDKDSEGNNYLTYLIFDFIACNNDRLTNYTFYERIKKLNTIISILNKKTFPHEKQDIYSYGIGSFSIQMKQFYRTKDTEKLLKIIIPNLAHKSDSLILQLNNKYKTKNINYNLKWRPKIFNSIDLLLKMKKKKVILK